MRKVQQLKLIAVSLPERNIVIASKKPGNKAIKLVTDISRPRHKSTVFSGGSGILLVRRVRCSAWILLMRRVEELLYSASYTNDCRGYIPIDKLVGFM